MRSISLVFGFLSLFVVIAVWGSESLATENLESPQRGVCAHRGAMVSHPENTLPAFQAAIRLGAHMIEFDVQRCKDGELVIMHDATVDRTTNGTGRVSDLTLAELKALDAGIKHGREFEGVTIPTLDETLAVMPHNIWLNVHLRGDAEDGARTASKIVESGRQHQAFIAAGVDGAKGAREAHPEILICNMERQSSDMKYARETIANGHQFIQILGRGKPVEPAVIAVLKENQIRINYFGTDDPDVLRALFEAGVEFPLVNDLEPMIAAAKALGIEPVKPVFSKDATNAR